MPFLQGLNPIRLEFVAYSACSAFALEAARLLKEKGTVSPAPAVQPDAAEDPEDGELPTAPAVVQEQAGKKRKHSPIVWQQGGLPAGM